MSRIILYTIGFGRPDLLKEQERLINKFLLDDHGFVLVDNSLAKDAPTMEATCRLINVGYLRSAADTHQHPDGLTVAANHADEIEAEFWGVIDHDIFPTCPTELIPLIEKAGFYGLGQTHVVTGLRYIWPGFAFFSRAWLAGRKPDFGGIRSGVKAQDGDAGSMLHSLFTEDDWQHVHSPHHGYEELRPQDEHGLQSWGFERIGDWIHFTNASHWRRIPASADRDRRVLEMLAAL